MTIPISTHLPPLIRDLGVIFLASGLAAVAFSYLRQPLIVGYLLVGYLIGPHFPYFTHLAEPEGVRLWGEIGVIFLLFSLGLEFSFKKLLSVGPSAFFAATVEVVCMFVAGYFTARAFQMSSQEALFWGGMLSISSTTVLIRAIEDSGAKSARFAQNVFGILIVEDLYAILLLVLLAASGSSGVDIIFSTLFRFSFFLIVVFVLGISILPVLIRKAEAVLSDETRIILSLGLCFTVVVLATKFGFSATLGAFLMGSLIAGTREARKIESLLLPLRNLFGAVFFVSVGLDIQPSIVWNQPLKVVGFFLVVLFGKMLFVTVGSLISGKPIKPSVRSGVSMAQVGEFSFVMAALGLSADLLSSESSSIIVVVATLTTFTTPFFVNQSKSIATWVDRTLPSRLKGTLDRYSSAIQRSGSVSETRMMLRKHLLILLVNSALIGAIALFFESASKTWAGRSGGLLLAIILTAPFFWGIAKGGLKDIRFKEGWMNSGLRPILVFLMVVRSFVFISLTGFLVSRFFILEIQYLILFGFSGGVMLFFSKRLETVYERFVQRFLISLSESEIKEVEKPGSLTSDRSGLTPWDGHIALFEMGFNPGVIGKTLAELKVREHHGVMIAMVERNGRKIPVPSGFERLYPLDRLHVIGGDDELARFQEFLVGESSVSESEGDSSSSYSLESISMKDGAPFIGLTIRDCGIREKVNGLVVGVERDGTRIINPSADFLILRDDLLWIVGDSLKVRALSS